MRLGVYGKKSAKVGCWWEMRGDLQKRTSWCGWDNVEVSSSSSPSSSSVSSSLGSSEWIEAFTLGTSSSAESSSCECPVRHDCGNKKKSITES